MRAVKTFTGIFYLKDITNTSVVDSFGQFVLDSKISQASGLRVLVHESETIPDMSEGFNIPPGSETTISIDMEKYLRMNKPYGCCEQSIYLNAMNMGEAMYKYTFKDCLSLCMQQRVIDACNCISSDYIVIDTMESSYPFCNALSENNVTLSYEYMTCKENAQQELDSENCKCDVPCNETSYQLITNSAPWPHETQHLIFYENYLYNSSYFSLENIDFNISVYEELSIKEYNGEEYIINDLRNIDFIKRNFVNLNVKLIKSSITEIVQHKTMDFSSLMGTIGGLFNLWIGITFVTVVEFIELLYNLLCVSSNENDVVQISINKKLDNTQ